MKNAKCKTRTKPSASKRCGVVVAILHFACCVLPSAAQTTRPTLSASLGFNGVFRPDSWTPVYVTIADPTSRSGTIEIRTARGRIGNVISARIQSNPKPTTFTLYAPLDPLDHVAVEWRDADGKLVSWLEMTEKARENPAALGGPVFGVAGQLADANRVAAQIVRDTGEYVAAGAITSSRLPERSTGYHALDVLVLAGLNTDDIDDAVEEQIVQWVRAGGMLVTWPGAQLPSEGSPLAAVLPVTMGEVVPRMIDGREVAVRSMKRIDRVARGPSYTDAPIARSLGLGRVSVFAFDPTQVYASIEQRTKAFREAVHSEVSLSADDRRVGSFDPLVSQARGEEQLPLSVRPGEAWLWIGLAIGLVMGPGDALLLLLCRRPIFTPLTLTGLAIVLGSGLALSLKSSPVEMASIELIVEDGGGILSRSTLGTVAPDEAAAAWLVGRSTDPLHEIAGELQIDQRQNGVDAGAVIALSDRLPRVRSISFAQQEPMLLVNGPLESPAAKVQSADEGAWEKAVVITPGEIYPLSSAPTAASALGVGTHAQPSIDSDDPATARRETGIEALAKQPGWEPLLMDRHLSQRIVRIFESERTVGIVAMRKRGDAKQFVIHLQRL